MVTVNKVSSVTFCVGIAGNDGGMFVVPTRMVKVLVVVRCGLIKSYGLLLVAMVVIRLVLKFWAGDGVQVMTPLELMLMPTGGLANA